MPMMLLTPLLLGAAVARAAATASPLTIERLGTADFSMCAGFFLRRASRIHPPCTCSASACQRIAPSAVSHPELAHLVSGQGRNNTGLVEGQAAAFRVGARWLRARAQLLNLRPWKTYALKELGNYASPPLPPATMLAPMLRRQVVQVTQR